MERGERRERGFFGRILVFILTILAVIGLIAMAYALITWLSYTDHVTAHALMTWLFGH